jgi:hypothetical protein
MACKFASHFFAPMSPRCPQNIPRIPQKNIFSVGKICAERHRSRIASHLFFARFSAAVQSGFAGRVVCHFRVATSKQEMFLML